MTAIDRTAYPRHGGKLTREELDARYSISETEDTFIRATARSDAGRLTLAALLKARQDLGFFPAPTEIHNDTIAHLASQLSLGSTATILNEQTRKKTLHHYRAAVRVYLKASIYAEAGEKLVTETVIEAAATMSDPADLINRAIEALSKASIDLPAFSTLGRLANHLRTQVHTQMYEQVAALTHPLILYDLKNPAKRAAFCNHFGKALHKREEAMLRHRWNEFVQHATLPK